MAQNPQGQYLIYIKLTSYKWLLNCSQSLTQIYLFDDTSVNIMMRNKNKKKSIKQNTPFDYLYMVSKSFPMCVSIISCQNTINFFL